MRGVNTGIQNGDLRRAHDRHTSVGLVPINLWKGPLLQVAWVIGHTRGTHLDGGFGPLDGGEARVRSKDAIASGGRYVDDMGSNLREATGAAAAGIPDRSIYVGACRRRPEL